MNGMVLVRSLLSMDVPQEVPLKNGCAGLKAQTYVYAGGSVVGRCKPPDSHALPRMRVG